MSSETNEMTDEETQRIVSDCCGAEMINSHKAGYTRGTTFFMVCKECYEGCNPITKRIAKIEG